MTSYPAEIQTESPSAPNEPIRVLFVSHDTGMYGAQRSLLTLLSGIDRRVCSPLLVVPYDGPLAPAATELEIPVFVKRMVPWVPGWSVSTKKQHLRHLYNFFRTLNRRCRAIERLVSEHGVDLVYTNTVTCIEGAIAAKRARKPHIWHLRESILGNKELTPLLPYKLYCTAVEALSTSIIFNSRALSNDYPRLSAKAHIVYNGFPVPPLRDRIAARAEVTRGLGTNSGVKLVAVVGALHPRKDLHTFLAAAEQVARRVEEAVFLIVGTGPESYINLLLQRIRDLKLELKVRLLGWRDDIDNILAASDVLVISSEQESFGRTMIEALTTETPVVATRCGGPEEILVDGETGLLVPVKDPVAMADAITTLLMDPKFARRLGINGRIHVSRNFGVGRYVQGIQDVLVETATGMRIRAPGLDAQRA